MLVVSWNVNSVKSRLERLQNWLQKHQPDIVCLQELKIINEKFPFAELKALGYEAQVSGQKAYNGVAVLSRVTPSQVRVGFEDGDEETDARLISVCIHNVWYISVYVPNGQSAGSEKYIYKLAFFERLYRYLNTHFKPTDNIVLVGDFNVAPEDRDVKNPENWAHSVLCLPQVRQAFEKIKSFGFVDCFRKHHQEAIWFSWWDYRMLGFVKNDGLRIDHILATAAMAEKCFVAEIDREERKGKLPSDHAPVMARFLAE